MDAGGCASLSPRESGRIVDDAVSALYAALFCRLTLLLKRVKLR